MKAIVNLVVGKMTEFYVTWRASKSYCQKAERKKINFKASKTLLNTAE